MSKWSERMLKGKAAVITGGSRGIGRAIAHVFASQGASVVLVADEDRAGLDQVAAEVTTIGAKVLVLPGDVADPEVSKKTAQIAKDAFGSVDILVNGAGIITRIPVESLLLKDWNRVLDVNLHGTFHMCRAVLPFMRAQGHGKVINISSQMARLPHPNASPSYEVSKAGQIALTRHLAYHYARHNICVNAIAPGSIDTRMADTLDPAARQKLRQGIPLGRLGRPEEVADCALFLASSLSDYITGATIDINGGSWMP